MRFLALFVVIVIMPIASAANPSGERLAYLVGCVNCHHQTPKEIMNAPPLAIVQAYSIAEFKKLMRTGVTRGGRDMLAESSVMGIVAAEQFAYFTDDEVAAVYEFLRGDWTPERATKEESKIPLLFKHKLEAAPELSLSSNYAMQRTLGNFWSEVAPMKPRLLSRTQLLALGTAVLFLARPADGQEMKAADGAADREEILTIVKRWEIAWNKHDMAAFGTMFHDDGVWVLWTGSVWIGRRAIEDGHAAVHKTHFRNSIQRELIEELTFVSPDAAVVRFCSMLTGDERTPDKIIRSRKILIVTKRDGIWRVGWGQNTRLADTAPDSECFASLRN